jgi:hypothetical protein
MIYRLQNDLERLKAATGLKITYQGNKRELTQMQKELLQMT